LSDVISIHGKLLSQWSGKPSTLKKFCGGPGGMYRVFQKSPLELVKGTKRVRSVGWAGLMVKKVLLFLPIRWPLKDPDQLVSAGCRPGPVYSSKRY